MTWADALYKYKMKITLNNNLIQGNETSFPILVSLTDDRLRINPSGGHIESPNGYDIKFYNYNESTPLNHEIEKYDSITGEIIMWVSVPNIYSSANPANAIYMYYGKPGVVIDPSSTNTWDANFLRVFHMDSVTTTVDDSTGTADLTKDAAGDPVDSAGKIGRGLDFDASNEEGLEGDKLGALTDITVELWFNPGVIGSYETTIQNTYDAEVGYTSTTFTIPKDADEKMWFNVSDGTQWMVNIGSTNTVSDMSYIVARLDDEVAAYLYINMNEEASDESITGSLQNHADAKVRVGRDYYSGGGGYRRFADGILDEIRISDNYRTVNWLTTTYNCQQSSNTFISPKLEESQTYSGSKVIHSLGYTDNPSERYINTYAYDNELVM